MGQSKRPLDKDLKHLSRNELDKTLKEQAAIDKEKIEAMGQENEHAAAKWVKEVGKEEREKEADRVNEVLSKLEDSKRSILTYKGLLMEEMGKEMQHWADDVPAGFQWLHQSTDKGIVLWIRNPQHEYFAKGIILSHRPEVDTNAIARMIVTALKEMIKQSEAANTTPNGIILPYK